MADAGIDNTTAVKRRAPRTSGNGAFDPSAIDIVHPRHVTCPVARINSVGKPNRGHFDAIVLGKQGLSWFERMLSKNSGT